VDVQALEKPTGPDEAAMHRALVACVYPRMVVSMQNELAAMQRALDEKDEIIARLHKRGQPIVQRVKAIRQIDGNDRYIVMPM